MDLIIGAALRKTLRLCGVLFSLPSLADAIRQAQGFKIEVSQGVVELVLTPRKKLTLITREFHPTDCSGCSGLLAKQGSNP